MQETTLHHAEIDEFSTGAPHTTTVVAPSVFFLVKESYRYT